ncbi:MAG: glycosyltransferase family 2 protein [Gammaproteobacteria bacterium]|nr:glycosyltransferase family 2 protein [Gammaproteobacteria bacterium]
MEVHSTCAILIVNWNSWELLTKCIRALAKQTCKEFRVYVADNASDEAPPEGIFSVLPNVYYLPNEQNLGFAAANNRLLEISGGSQWTILLNPDAYPEPDWLEQLMNATKNHAEYTFFASRLLMDGKQDVLDGDGDVYHLSGLVWRAGHGKKVGKGGNSPREVFSPCAAAAMYRTDVINEAGGFDEDFFCYLEDVDLGFRLRLAGHRCLLVPLAIVNHVGSATSGGQQSDFAVYHGHRNLVWTYVKNMPAALLWMCLPLHLLVNLVTLLWYSVRGRTGLISKSKLEAIKGIPLAWRKRKLVQSERVITIAQVLYVMDKRFIPFTG